MTEIEHLFILIIRVALGTSEHLPFQLTEKQWKTLFLMGKKQQMSGILFAAIEKLPKEERPPLRALMQFHAPAEYIRLQNDKHRNVLAEFARLMEHYNRKYVVFKGLAAAVQYNKLSSGLSNYRTTGDIDFYVPASDFDSVLSDIQTTWRVPIEEEKIDKHYSFDYDEIRFEMHYQMETFGWFMHQRYFSKLADDSFNQLTSFAVTDEVRDSVVPIPMLPPMVDLMLVFKHWFTHLLGEGVGLRQTVDVAVLINAYKDEIDIKTLQKHLSAIGYRNAFDAIVALVDKYFGIKWQDYKVKSWTYKYADKLMADVLKNGNFGKTAGEHKIGRAKRIETTRRFFTHCFRYFPLAKLDIAMSVPLRIAISIKAH